MSCYYTVKVRTACWMKSYVTENSFFLLSLGLHTDRLFTCFPYFCQLQSIAVFCHLLATVSVLRNAA